jgi:hypothetical protein
MDAGGTICTNHKLSQPDSHLNRDRHCDVRMVPGRCWCNSLRDRVYLPAMAKYALNAAAVTKACELIDARQYVLDSDWGDVQPKADDQNAFLENHGWDDYAQWHLGLTEGAQDETKARYAFVYGDFRRVHRTALIACVYRASEWRHKDVELAAHELLQYLDKATG